MRFPAGILPFVRLSPAEIRAGIAVGMAQFAANCRFEMTALMPLEAIPKRFTAVSVRAGAIIGILQMLVLPAHCER